MARLPESWPRPPPPRLRSLSGSEMEFSFGSSPPFKLSLKFPRRLWGATLGCQMPPSTAESERLVRFTRLFGIALGVFGKEAAACSWLKTENPGTAGETPLSYWFTSPPRIRESSRGFLLKPVFSVHSSAANFFRLPDGAIIHLESTPPIKGTIGWLTEAPPEYWHPR